MSTSANSEDLILLRILKKKNLRLRYYEQRKSKRNELAVDSFFPQSYGTFKQRDTRKL